MAKLKRKDIPSQLSELGLNKKLTKVFFEFIHEKFWQESIDIYKKLSITRKSLDEKDKIYLLIKSKNSSYDVNLEITNNELNHFCNCAHRENFKGCAHAGAVLLYKILKKEKNDFNSKLGNNLESKKNATSDLNYFKALFPKIDTSKQQNMIYFNFEDFDKERQLLVVQRGIIRKDGGYGLPMKFNAKNFDSSKWKISKDVGGVLKFISDANNYSSDYSSSGFSKYGFYDINTDLMMPVLKKIYFEEQEIILGAIFSKEKFEISWDISKNNSSYIIEPFFVYGNKKKSLLKMDLIEIGSNSLWAYDCKKRCFYESEANLNLEVIRSIIRLPKKLEFNEKELMEFFLKYYPKIVDNFKLNLSDELKRKTKYVVPKAKLYLEKAGSSIKIKLKFDYSSREIDYFSSNKDIILIEDNVIYDIHRDVEIEDETVEKLNDLGVVTHEEMDEFVIDCDLIDFIVNNLPKIIKNGIEVFGEDKLFNFKIIKNKPKMNIKVAQKTDWFEIKGDVKFGKDSVKIQAVLDAIFQNKRFVELSDGVKAVIPKKWINSLKAYSGFIDTEKNDAKLSKNHIAIINDLIKMSNNVDMSDKVKQVISSFNNFDKIKSIELSKNIKTKLRDYQKVGYDWLYFLREFGFNGILADDMGLGKTLQTLCLLQKLKEEKVKNPFLVVVPTSLVFNWKSEIEKFTPGMKVYIHHGTNRKNNKKSFNESVRKNDLIITTYGVLRNNLKLFSDIEFEYIVLDEAHLIKNPMSISAKTVCSLKGKNKLAISGTPIQNNLTELWSLFNFLNPGYLGGYEFFKENFISLIEKNNDKSINESLKKLISPFLLRRTKKVIEDELPEKNEMILKSSFSTEEREIYNNWRDFYKNEISTNITENGINKSKIKILEGLMKLRQICLHPKLIDASYTGRSSKFDLLMMEVEKVLSEGHKVLIFSSFVKMLSLVKNEFEEKGIKYFYLDGQTKNREKVVSNFQESSEAHPFLISIKAGGLGLNLTEADYVFIIDPWWNPAVEMQAMDRAHRIGQKNKVFVYKIITENTIEEKILKLQDSKKKLVKDLIVEEQSLVKNINVKDIKEIFG